MGRGEDCTEALVMKNYLISKGIPASKIIEEDASHSTEENFRNSYEIIADLLGDEAKIAFVTTQFHVFRAERIANKLGIDTWGIPAKDMPILVLNNYLRECAAIVNHFFRGKI